jgi:hypothetical protein
VGRQQESGHACRQVDRQAGGRQAGGQAGMQGDRQADRGPAARHVPGKNCVISRWKYYFEQTHTCRFGSIQEDKINF